MPPVRPSKVMILGVDAPIVPRVRKYLAEGEMPHLQSLVDRGTLAENCLVPYPTITPPNWTTIVTGAWPGTHGITCFHVHNPGDALSEVHAGFDSCDNQAEYLWEALAREGLRSIVFNYPSTWPPRMGELGIQVAGAGLAPNEWRHHFPTTHMWDVRNDVSNSQLFATDDYPHGQVVEIVPAAGWANAPEGADRELALEILGRNALSPLVPQTWYGLLLKDETGRYTRLCLATQKDCAAALCTLAVGEWSERLEREFVTEAGPKRAVFRFKLLELDPAGREIKLLLSPLCALEGFSHPAEIGAELAANVETMPLPSFGIAELQLEWIDDDTWCEWMWENHRWMAEAQRYLLANQPWDLFAAHLHCPDWAYHAFATRIDPLTEADPAVRARFERLEREFHRAWDYMLGEILSQADENTLVVVVSDHGAQASIQQIPLRDILVAGGLMALKENEDGEQVVDWTRTKVAVQRSCYLYVNLKGRDPEGIVEPEAYEEVREQAIACLLDYTDPATGRKPFTLVMKREDARVLGLYGERIGDVVFAYSGDFLGGQHGSVLPTAKTGIGSIEGLLLFAGPGVKAGATLERTAWLTDLVPTICYLAQWPIPRQAEGGVLYQALEDPDLNTNELKKLRRNYDRLKRVETAEKALEHRGNM